MDDKMQALLSKLSAPFPPEAHEVDDSRGSRCVLVGIKGAYVVERLNEIFGPCGVGWNFKTTAMTVDNKWAIVDLELSYRLNDHWSEPIPVVGSCNVICTKGYPKGRIGDAKKGAIQDGIKKAASYLGVGQEAYKGLLKPATRPSTHKYRGPASGPAKKAKLPAKQPAVPVATEEDEAEGIREALEAPVRAGKSKWHQCTGVITRAKKEIPYYEGNIPHIIATLKKLETEGVITWDATSVDDVFDALNKYASRRANEKAAKE